MHVCRREENRSKTCKMAQEADAPFSISLMSHKDKTKLNSRSASSVHRSQVLLSPLGICPALYDLWRWSGPNVGTPKTQGEQEIGWVSMGTLEWEQAGYEQFRLEGWFLGGGTMQHHLLLLVEVLCLAVWGGKPEERLSEESTVELWQLPQWMEKFSGSLFRLELAGDIFGIWVMRGWS